MKISKIIASFFIFITGAIFTFLVLAFTFNLPLPSNYSEIVRLVPAFLLLSVLWLSIAGFTVRFVFRRAQPSPVAQKNTILFSDVEALLQKEPLEINYAGITHQISGKRILVTGAAGSIGSELVRQLLRFHPAKVVLCDQAETALHDLFISMSEEFPGKTICSFIGSVQNRNRMEKMFRDHRPQLVFHAAAYKHVPMMEENPSEAVLANVLGTKNISELAMEYGTEKFIMVSSDKAVNPSSIMGASKRIAEMYVHSFNDRVAAGHKNDHATKFITSRFGNVLGSQGSVLPRFRSQIEKGGPVTVTHPDITRFFMTIPEAVQLVLEAATMGNGGEIYVFDMGTPVKILDMATTMIRLAGKVPYKDIKIEFTGLRPGEKLYEEILGDDETTAATYHPKIRIARVNSKEYLRIQPQIEELVKLSLQADDMKIAAKMKQIVTDFVSRNSAYEHLDYLNKIKVIPGNDGAAHEVIAIPPATDIPGHTQSSLSA